MYNDEKDKLIFEYLKFFLKKSKIVQQILEIKEIMEMVIITKSFVIKCPGVQIKNKISNKKK